MSQIVDYKQSPEDFAKSVLNPQEKPEAAPQGQPVTVPPVAPPQPEGIQVPENKEGEKVAPELPSAPQGQPDMKTPEELMKANAEARDKIRVMGEEKKKLFTSFLSLVEAEPDAIHNLNRTNPELAQKVIKEHWGFESYEELTERARIAELEKVDPDEARRDKELFELKMQNKQILQGAKRNVETVFFEKHGINANPFDPNYQKLMEEMQNINPHLIQSDYHKALTLAHKMAFPNLYTKEAINSATKEVVLASAGSPEADSKKTPPKAPSNLSNAQKAFGAYVGVNL